MTAVAVSVVVPVSAPMLVVVVGTTVVVEVSRSSVLGVSVCGSRPFKWPFQAGGEGGGKRIETDQ
jgi:hypothetical protein